MVLRDKETTEDIRENNRFDDMSSEKMVSDSEVPKSLPKSLTRTPEKTPTRITRSLSKELRGMEINQRSFHEKSTVEHDKKTVEADDSLVIESPVTVRQQSLIEKTCNESDMSLVNAEDLLSFSPEVQAQEDMPLKNANPESSFQTTSFVKPSDDSKNASQSQGNDDSDESSIIEKNGNKRRRLKLDSTVSEMSEANEKAPITNLKNAKMKANRAKWDARRKMRQDKVKQLEKQIEELKNGKMQVSQSDSMQESSSHFKSSSSASPSSDSSDSEVYDPQCKNGVRKLKSKSRFSKIVIKKTNQPSSSKSSKKKNNLDQPKAGIVHPAGQGNYWHSAIMVAYLLKGYCEFKHYSDIYSSYSHWFPMSANHLTVRDKLKNTVKDYNNQTRPAAYVAFENERNTVIFDTSFKPGRRVEPATVREELKKLCPDLTIR